MDDPIKQLLATTGLTCDELLRKLQDYKSSAIPSSKDEPPTNPDKTDEAATAPCNGSGSVTRNDPPSAESLADVDSTSDDVDDAGVSTESNEHLTEANRSTSPASGILEDENLQSSCDKCDQTTCNCQTSTNIPLCATVVNRNRDLTSSVLPKDINKLFGESVSDPQGSTDSSIAKPTVEVECKSTSPKAGSSDKVLPNTAQLKPSQDDNQQHSGLPLPQEDDSSLTVSQHPNASEPETEEFVPENICTESDRDESIRSRKSSQADEIYCNEISSTEEDDIKTVTCTHRETPDKEITDRVIETEENIPIDLLQGLESKDELDEDVVSSSIIDSDNHNDKTELAVNVNGEDSHSSVVEDGGSKLQETASQTFVIDKDKLTEIEKPSEDGHEISDQRSDKANDLTADEAPKEILNSKDKSVSSVDAVGVQKVDDCKLDYCSTAGNVNNTTNNITDTENDNQEPDLTTMTKKSEDHIVIHNINDDESNSSCEIIDTFDNKNKIDIIEEDDEINFNDLQKKFLPKFSEFSDSEGTSNQILSASFDEDTRDIQQNIATDNFYEYVNDSDMFDEEDDVFNEDEEEDFNKGSLDNTKDITESENTTDSNFVEVSDNLASINNNPKSSKENAEDPLSVESVAAKNYLTQDDPLFLSDDNSTSCKGQFDDPLCSKDSFDDPLFGKDQSDDPLSIENCSESIKAMGKVVPEDMLWSDSNSSKAHKEEVEDPLLLSNDSDSNKKIETTENPLLSNIKIIDTLSVTSKDSEDTLDVNNSSEVSNTKPIDRKDLLNENKTLHSGESEDNSDDLKVNTDSDNQTSPEKQFKDEQIRDILKLQLSSLRNRKRKEAFKIDSKDVLNKVAKLNPKKKLANVKVDESLDNAEKTEESDYLIEMSNETDLVISAVVGGFDDNQSHSITDVFNAQKINKIHAETEDEIRLTKTNDITKIKGWKNKKFSRNIQASCNDKVISDPVEEVRKIISKNRDDVKKDVAHAPPTRALTNVNINSALSGSLKVPDGAASASCDKKVTKTTQSSSNISPFVSNILDDFLNLDSSLQISYDIPKLDAEEGLVTVQDPVPSTLMATELKDDKSQVNTSNAKPVPEIKAKTLAEKRRILERINKQAKKQKDQGDKIVKPDNKEEIENDPIPKKRVCKGLFNEKFGYILYNNRKIWVPTRCGDPFIGEVRDRNALPLDNTAGPLSKKTEDVYKRPSLLTHLQKVAKPVNYKPGPLSKKFKLCKEECKNNGETCIKKLPQIYLDVVPELRKGVPREITHLFPNFGFEVNEIRAEFALTALVDKRAKKEDKALPKRVFRVPVKYANDQKFVLARKTVCKKEEILPVKQEIKDEVAKKRPTCLEDEIKAIVNDLLNYIETKEIEDTLIKSDEPITYSDSSVQSGSRKPREINDKISTIVRKDPKKRKIDLELLRLNCKVVNVTLEESNENNCQKPYCQMGCVCQSLRCENMVISHCRKLGCMFDCTCPKQKSVNYDAEVVLPAGTDLFSSDAVLKIDDRAKKNLARVEREFTQTIIYANDKTIVVSAGGRDKLRRATKTPKKYTDFFEDNDGDEKNVEKKVPETPTDPKLKSDCHIPVQRLGLENVIPFCLSHEQHDCFCKGRCSYGRVKFQPREHDKAAVLAKKETEKPTVVQNASVSQKPASAPKSLATPNKSPIKSFGSKKVAKPSTPELRAPVSPSEDRCARLKEVFINFKTRNSQPEYTKRLHKFIRTTSSDSFPETALNKKTLDSQKTDCQRLKEFLAKEKLKLYTQHKPETVTSDSVDEKAIQRRKKAPKPIVTYPPAKANKVFIHSNPIFEGELILPVKTNEEFLNVLSINCVPQGYIRILPWINLLNGHKSGAIQVFRHKSDPHNYLVSTKEGALPRGYLPLTSSLWGGNDTDFARWIREGIFPVQKTFLYTVLVPYDSLFHIVAFCLNSFEQKNTSMVIVLLNQESSTGNGNSYLDKLQEAERLMLKKAEPGKSPTLEPIGETIISSNLGDNKQSLFRLPGEKRKQNLSALERYIHKDAAGKKQVLGLIQHDLPDLAILKLEPYKETKEVELFKDDILSTKMKVHLPDCVGKWRMIYMRSDFTYLVFEKTNYNIKYTDLKKILCVAMGVKKTISLHSNQFSNDANTPIFGIYASHAHADRIFVGPYNADEGHGLCTWRYMRRSLVSTEVFNKMQGKLGNRIGIWLRRIGVCSPKSVVQSKASPKASGPLTIDLTSDETPETSSAADGAAQSSKPSPSKLVSGARPKFRSILKRPPPQTEGVAAKKAKLDESSFTILPMSSIPHFNRYILSNIPHLGYIGAYVNNEGEFLIAWVFHNKALKFKSANDTLNFLEQRLCMLLQPVPLTFKIKFLLMKSIDHTVHKQIDNKYLNGHYICGDFGVHDVKSLTQEVLDSIGITRDEVVNGLSRRVQNIIMQRMRELGSVLYETNTGQFSSDLALVDAKKEIDRLEKLNKLLEMEKSILETSKNEKVQILHKILDGLPQERRIVEYNKFKCYTRFTTAKVAELPPDNTDAIEILDSTDISYAEKSDCEVDCPKTITSERREEREESPDVEEIVQEQECIEILDSDEEDSQSMATLTRADAPATDKRQSQIQMPKLTEVFGKKIKLKPLPESYKLSLLKPNLSKSPEKPPASSPILSGVKCVKTKAGKFVLVKTPSPEKQETGGTRILIKNNKVYTISASSVK